MRFGIFLLLLLLISPGLSLELKTHKKTQTITFRIAAVAERVPRSSFSPNRETYLAYLASDDESSKTAKIVFQYLGYEDGLSSDFADFGLLHTFKAARDRSCDESWQSFSTKFVRGKDGNAMPVVITRYASPDAVEDIAANQVLPCYVIAPKGYKRSKAVSVPQPNPQIAGGKVACCVSNSRATKACHIIVPKRSCAPAVMACALLRLGVSIQQN